MRPTSASNEATGNGRPPGDSPACVACGSARLVPHFAVEGEVGSEGLIPTTHSFGTALSNIVRCPACTHMQLERFPTDAELADAYGEAASEDYVSEEAGQRQTAQWVLERIERVSPPGRLLDLGCWVGYLLDEARERGWSVLGIEPSGFAAGYARDRLGLEVIHAGLEEVELEAGEFDAVFLGDVIEHLPDAGGALDRIGDALRPGGVVALAVPDAGSRVARAMGPRWWAVIPTHVHYFTRKSLGTLLDRHGFTPMSFENAPKSFTVRYYLGRTGGYEPHVANALVALAERLGVAERQWAPDFGDRMLVLATAPGS